MPGKNTLQRRIDRALAARGGAAVQETTPNYAPPAIKALPAPQNLALDSLLGRSAATPTAIITATWDRPKATYPQEYVIQVSTSNTFPDGGTTTYTARSESATLDGLKPATLYYVRVAAVYRAVQSAWSDVESITTESDTIAAAQPTSLAGAWIGTGDLLLTLTNPTDENFKDVELRIYASNGGTLLRTVYTAAGRYLYTLALNLQDTSGVGDPSLYIIARSRTFSNVLNSTSAPTLTTTKSAPSAPAGLTQTWSGDTNNNGTAGADWTLKWTRSDAVARYQLTIDSVARLISGQANAYTYALGLNASEHSGTADPVLSYSLVAVDGFGQASTATSGTATNEEPPTTAIAIAAGFSALSVSATPTTVADFRDYTFRIILGGVTQATYRSTNPDQMYKATVAGSYTVGVKVNDLFGQASTETVSSAVVLDALTIEELRSELTYTSDDGQTQANLNKLKDGDLTTGATSHAASASAWLTITGVRPSLDRYGVITFVPGSIVTGTLKVYFALSADGTTWTYYSGALQPTGSTGQNTTLAAYAVEANAQTNAITVTAGTVYRFDVPTITEARYIVLKHRNTTGNYTLREFYPRRLLQTDDFEAESIRAINIASDQILANHINAAFTITGKNIQTATSGARVVLSGDTNGGVVGYGGSDTYSTTAGTGTYQLLWSKADGKLYAGGGQVVLDANGVHLLGRTVAEYTGSTTAPNTVSWKIGSETIGSIESFYDAGSTAVLTIAASSASYLGKVTITAKTRVGMMIGTGSAQVISVDDSGTALIKSPSVELDGAVDIFDSLSVGTSSGGINVGTATGAGAGDIRASGGINAGVATGAPNGGIAATANDASTTTTVASLTLGHNSTGTPGAGFGVDIPINMESSTTADQSAALIRTTWVTATHASRAARMRFFVYDTTARTVMDLEASGSAAKIGFLGAAAVTRPAVTGVSSGTPTAAQQAAVIRSILTALSSLGLITDSTT